MAKIRIDKYLAEMGKGTRSEVKAMIRKKQVCINQEPVRTADQKVDPGNDLVTLGGVPVSYAEKEYFMMNKPAGVVSATRDPQEETVLNLLQNALRKDLFPVGRLDKDTEGLLLLTNDGNLAHDLLSPKKHVNKCYYARICGKVTRDDCEAFSRGVDIGDEKLTLPAQMEILTSGENSEIKITIREGRYHQIKRMFQAVGKEVTYLKRLSMGSLVLDPSLKPGESRALTSVELEQLISETKHGNRPEKG